MNNADFKDKRILEAFDYIDPKYIAEVAESLKLKSVRTKAEEIETRVSPFKHWRQFVALAASLILLSFAFPVFNYIAENTDFFAGWGSGTEEVTDENGIPYTYPMFVDDLEELSSEEMIAIDNLFYQYNYDQGYDEYYQWYLHQLERGKEITFNAEYAVEQAKYGADRTRHRFFNEMYYGTRRYYGKINDCVILASEGAEAVFWSIDIAGYKFEFSNSAIIYVIKDNVIYDIKEAYDLGYLTDEQIALLAERHEVYETFSREWEIEMNEKYKK